MKIGLEPSTQTTPEGNATNANFTWTNNTQSLADADRDVMQTGNGFPNRTVFGCGKATFIVQKQVFGKLVNDGLLVRALPYGTVGWTNSVLL